MSKKQVQMYKYSVYVLVKKEDRMTRYGDDAFVTYHLYSLVIIPLCTNNYGLLPLRL